jgi:hypothetical protein
MGNQKLTFALHQWNRMQEDQIIVETLMPNLKTLAMKLKNMSHAGEVKRFLQLLELFPNLETLYLQVMSQARDARHKSEAISEKAIGDIAKLGGVMSSAMAGLGVSLGPRTPEMLIEEAGRLPGVVRELELSTARRAVHRVLAMFESHYQGLDRTALSGG